VSYPAGSYDLGPRDGTLSVHTGRTGAAAKAGHDLVLHVTTWQASLTLADEASAARVELTADAASLRVREGSGGIQALGDDDKADIEKTIDKDVLKKRDIAFRSTAARAEGDGRLTIEGELTLLGTSRPLAFELAVADDGAITGEAVVKQSEWGIKPYSALFGALKVADEVTVRVDGRLPQSR
jgi:polyisoprenoid-binding protein YceI